MVWILIPLLVILSFYLGRKFAHLQNNSETDLDILISRKQVHDINNSITAVQLGLEGLKISGLKLNVNQSDLLENSLFYTKKISRGFSQFADLISFEKNHNISLKQVKTEIFDIIIQAGFYSIAKDIYLEENFSKLSGIIVFADKSKLINLFSCLTNLIAKKSLKERLLNDKSLNEINIDFRTKKVSFFINTNLSFTDITSDPEFIYLNKFSPVLGCEFNPSTNNDIVSFEFTLPFEEYQRNNNTVLVVSNNDSELTNRIKNSFYGICKQVDKIEDALKAVQNEAFSKIILDGSVDLGQKLALARILRNDLKINSNCSLVAPEMSIDSTLASEFGIDKVIDSVSSV
jgi:hypothetical protein